jgi:hypothetical protein
MINGGIIPYKINKIMFAVIEIKKSGIGPLCDSLDRDNIESYELFNHTKYIKRKYNGLYFNPFSLMDRGFDYMKTHKGIWKNHIIIDMLNENLEKQGVIQILRDIKLEKLLS